MKHYLPRGLLFFLALLLTGCSYYFRPVPSEDLACETWPRQVAVCSPRFMNGADCWFSQGSPNAIEEMNHDASANAAISLMKVRIPNCITEVRSSGRFHLQIYGACDGNSLFLYGPNAAVRGVVVRVHGNTLCVAQTEDAPCNIDSVIVRIGIRNLHYVNQGGAGIIEARLLRSNGLSIDSSGCGNIYLSGWVNLSRVVSTGKACINVFGAVTPQLDIITSGPGSVNICGNVGIHRIIHHGFGDINIVGANSNSLDIYADGGGKVGIRGHVDPRTIVAKDRARVYVCYANGCALHACVTDCAHIGLSGSVRCLAVDATRGGRFEGRYLQTDTAYVHARDAAHINVFGSQQVFASSTQNSSIYSYGSSVKLTKFGNGTIFSM